MRSQPLSEGSPYLPSWAEISRIEPLTESEKLFELHLLDGRTLGHQPGQFVELSIMGIGEAPISVSSPPGRGPSFELAIRRIGDVTAAAHRLNVGDTVGVRGPFGTCFPAEETQGKDLLVVAGPQVPFAPAEEESLGAFLAAGGRLLALLDPAWPELVLASGSRGSVAFQAAASLAVLHHIPGIENRRAFLARCARILAPGGGYVFATVHNIQANVPVENVEAMFRALRECGAA